MKYRKIKLTKVIVRGTKEMGAGGMGYQWGQKVGSQPYHDLTQKCKRDKRELHCLPESEDTFFLGYCSFRILS
jgi:hypothetical protein